MKKAHYYKHELKFKRPGGTSRGVLHAKETFILTIEEDGKVGVGECGLFRGLSFDDVPEYEEKLNWLCTNINENKELLEVELRNFPSIWIGVEQCLKNLENGADIYFPSDFTEGTSSIKINGLIWMGEVDFMRAQIFEKLELGFSCLKLKIGVDWPAEQKILKELRKEFTASKLELRVDANGAFHPNIVLNVLKELADLEIHSIEQPIKAGQIETMRTLCAQTPTPIALDEELIGIVLRNDKENLLKFIKPQYIILKPSLMGGFSGSDMWIEIAEEQNIGWWITSALESNIGLNAIAQYTFSKNNTLPQGLGTGSLYTNNFESRLQLQGEYLSMNVR